MKPALIPPIYGMMAEFDTPSQLIHAAERAYEAGYRKMDAYSPFPIEELHEAIGFHHTRLPLIVLVSGLLGTIGGYALEYWTQIINYPLNVGGRPFHSWPAFIPPAYETTILGAAFGAVFGMLALNGLPMPYHPVFNVEAFRRRGSHDGFFLCLEATDPKFDAVAARAFLESLGPRSVSEVPH